MVEQWENQHFKDNLCPRPPGASLVMVGKKNILSSLYLAQSIYVIGLWPVGTNGHVQWPLCLDQCHVWTTTLLQFFPNHNQTSTLKRRTEMVFKMLVFWSYSVTRKATTLTSSTFMGRRYVKTPDTWKSSGRRNQSYSARWRSCSDVVTSMLYLHAWKWNTMSIQRPRGESSNGLALHSSGKEYITRGENWTRSLENSSSCTYGCPDD